MEFYLACDLPVLWHTGWLAILSMDISYYCADNATDNMKVNLPVEQLFWLHGASQAYLVILEKIQAWRDGDDRWSLVCTNMVDQDNLQNI